MEADFGDEGVERWGGESEDGFEVEALCWLVWSVVKVVDLGIVRLACFLACCA